MTAAILERLHDPRRTENPWRALWAMMIGFFMILVDSTIVAVANPEIMRHLDTDYDGVIWVTSAYLLAYAVPLLLAGRLGDHFGPKNLYLIGLGVFTLASLWCGLAGSIEWLIVARVVQGLGAALMTPQTLSTITRIFPADRRGVALSVWGATAGVATLVGPLAGGFLIDALSWQWIFIVNVPIGIIGLALAFWFVPTLATTRRGFDVIGVLLSGVGLFLIVFGLQEGHSHDWAWWIALMVFAGLGVMVGFVYWQSVTRDEPLIPLKMFSDNDFSMSNIGIAVIGFAVTAMVVPMMFYAQAVRGYSPTGAALLMSPTAIASGVLAPFVGKIVDRAHPRPIVGFGFSAIAIAMTWLSVELTPTTPVWRLVLPLTLMGVGMAFIWSPLAATATRNLAPQLAGAGSGVYNTTRQVGGVLGSAGIAAFMTARIAAELPGAGQGAQTPEASVVALPELLREPFSAALSQSLLLPAFIALFGVISALFLRGSGDDVMLRPAPLSERDDELVSFTAALRTNSGIDTFVADGGRDRGRGYEPDYFPDDDEYVEFTVDWSEEPAAAPVFEPVRAAPRVRDDPTEVIEAVMADEIPADESTTGPMHAHVEHPLHAPADTWHSGPVDAWHSLLEDDLEPQLDPAPATTNGYELIGFAHNGFHVNGARHQQVEAPPEPKRGGRHSRDGEGDAGTYGKHSMPFRD